MSTLTLVSILGAISWLLMVRPVWTLIHDFGPRDGLFYARLYPHFFLFPVFIGGFVIYFLAQPTALVIDYLLSLGAQKVAVVYGIVFGLTFIITLIESFNRGAVWELSAQALAQDSNEYKGKSIKRITRKVLQYKVDLHNDDKLEYERRMRALAKDKKNRSRTYYSYRRAFGPFVAVFINLYAVILVLAASGVTIRNTNPAQHSLALDHMTIAALLIMVWPLMRIYFDREMRKILPSADEISHTDDTPDESASSDSKKEKVESFSRANALIVIIFAFAYALVFAAHFPEQRREVVGFFGVAFEIFTLVLAIFKPELIYNIGRYFWGVRAHPISLAMIAILILLMLLYPLSLSFLN